MNWIRVSIKGSQLLNPFSSSDFATFKYDIGERRERGCVAALTKGDRIASRQTCCRAEVCSRGRGGQALSEPSEYVSGRSRPGLVENFKEGSLRLEWCDRGIGDSQWGQALSTPPLRSQGPWPSVHQISGWGSFNSWLSGTGLGESLASAMQRGLLFLTVTKTCLAHHCSVRVPRD